jgi:hypothetical protein
MMIQRCTNADNDNYGNYGVKGIGVCDQWRTFDGFLADMGERPAGTSLDRINNRGHYEPGNCRWASPVIQAANTSRSIGFRSLDGTPMSIKSIADHLAAPASLIYYHLRRKYVPRTRPSCSRQERLTR